MTKNEKKFEQSLKDLEEIVDKLEEGDIPLEEALDKFQEGIDLSRSLKKKLKNAEDTLAKIVTEDGNEELFESEE
ncbi:MAG: exodeoxyribonuclease VII small subunit [Atopostipes suicloacalis]|nr:exodeoxyribonuclease VII small subunit [Atopostipes suicloacalis]MDN6730915.1 exodeoxyribonuclease VII small subunit [Atopostipes suicloacalis]